MGEEIKAGSAVKRGWHLFPTGGRHQKMLNRKKIQNTEQSVRAPPPHASLHVRFLESSVLGESHRSRLTIPVIMDKSVKMTQEQVFVPSLTR